MYARFKVVGVAMMVAGLAFVGVGGYTYARTSDGATSLEAFSTAQAVELTYNEDGQLVDRGETAIADEILALLTEDWGYPVVKSDLDPNDPLVNTATEYMYEMAAISYHTLTGTQTVAVADHTDYKDEHYDPGTYEVEVAGRYYAQFDRQSPLDGPARTQAWSPLALSLIANLGVGSVTASTIQMGLGIAALAAALGATLLALGAGLIWAARRAAP